MKTEIEVITDENRLRPEESEVERLWADTRKIKELTAWGPGYSLEEGLKETIKWFSNPQNLRFYKPGIYNI